MISDLDSQIGITVYSTKFPGIGGRIRTTPDDFEVNEIISDKAKKSINQESGYAVYKLKKKNIDTNHSLSDFFRKKGIRLKSLGLKDAYAVTEQYVCSMNKGKTLDDFSTDKYSISKIGYTKKPLSKKDMIGNHFRIQVSDCKDGLSEFHEENNILNFYGYQRFGSKRPVTHLIGKALIQRNFDKVIDLILSFTSPYDSKENTELREKLSDSSNYEKYLDDIPPQMDIERLVVKEMIHSNDVKKAFKSIPLSLRRFYVQAYQSYLFNLTLSAAFDMGENVFESQTGDVCYDMKGVLGKHVNGLDQILAIPIIGYSYYKKTRFHYYVSDILASEEISPKDFFIKEMQEISNEGGFRQSTITCTNFSTNKNQVEFTLSRGSFATIILREIMKPQDPIASGF